MVSSRRDVEESDSIVLVQNAKEPTFGPTIEDKWDNARSNSLPFSAEEPCYPSAKRVHPKTSMEE